MRNSTRFWRVLPLCAIAVSVLAACGSAQSGSASVYPAGAAPHTQRVYVSPVTSAGAPVTGFRVTSRGSNASCSAGSEAIGQAYRCFAGNGVYDPCWAEKAPSPTVLCLADPWLRTAAELHVNAPLGAIPNESGGAAAGQTSASEPWAVELSGGQHCILAQGAHNAFNGQVIDYYCPSGLALLRGLNLKAPQWTAHSVIDKSGKLTSGPTEKIETAWYGSPARFH